MKSDREALRDRKDFPYAPVEVRARARLLGGEAIWDATRASWFIRAKVGDKQYVEYV